MHPKSIQRFDMFYLGSIAVSAVGFFLGFDNTVAQTRAQYAQAGLNIDPSTWIAVAFVVGIGISVLLWWLVSSKGSNVAKWIVTVFFAIGLLTTLYALAKGTLGGLSIATGLSLLATALSGVGVFYLFQADAKEWLERERPQR